MATLAADSGTRRNILLPAALDRTLATGSALMLLVIIGALVRGYPHWVDAKAIVWVHLATIMVALA